MSLVVICAIICCCFFPKIFFSSERYFHRYWAIQNYVGALRTEISFSIFPHTSFENDFSSVSFSLYINSMRNLMSHTHKKRSFLPFGHTDTRTPSIRVGNVLSPIFIFWFIPSMPNTIRRPRACSEYTYFYSLNDKKRSEHISLDCEFSFLKFVVFA